MPGFIVSPESSPRRSEVTKNTVEIKFNKPQRKVVRSSNVEKRKSVPVTPRQARPTSPHACLTPSSSSECIVRSPSAPTTPVTPVTPISHKTARHGTPGATTPGGSARCDDFPLHDAAGWGRLENVKFWVNNQGVSVDALNDVGRTPLHYAARWGRLKVVEYLAGVHNADPNISNPQGWMPLHFAARWRRLRVCLYLIEHAGANPLAKDHKGRTPLDIAIMYKQTSVIDYLSQYGPCKSLSDQEYGDDEHILVATQSCDDLLPGMISPSSDLSQSDE